MEDRQQHVILGAGALGLAVMRVLHARGEAVTLINRSGHAPVPSGVELVAGDVTDPEDARRVCRGADVIYHCVGAPYGAWPTTLPSIMRGVLEGAAAAGAKLVYGDNLYMYGHVIKPMTEDLPHHAKGPNGRTRAQLAETLLEAHRQGRVRATIGRASDFYGPHARNSTVGDGVFLHALQGRAARVLGDPDAPHTYTFIDDFAHALVTLGEHEEALGEAWHVPSAPTLSTREFVALVYQHLGKPTRFAVAPKWAIRLMALMSFTMRAVHEVSYQSQSPWVVDHAKFERAFGAPFTPHDEAIGKTLDWYRKEVQEENSGSLATEGSRAERSSKGGG